MRRRRDVGKRRLRSAGELPEGDAERVYLQFHSIMKHELLLTKAPSADLIGLHMCTRSLVQKTVKQARLELATLGIQVVRATIAPPPLPATRNKREEMSSESLSTMLFSALCSDVTRHCHVYCVPTWSFECLRTHTWYWHGHLRSRQSHWHYATFEWPARLSPKVNL